jgi:hypothetical protein
MSQVEIRASPIHGKGIFALCDIPKGAVVCLYEGVLVPRTYASKSVYRVHVNSDFVLDGELVESLGKYINCPKGTGRKSNVKFGGFHFGHGGHHPYFPVFTKSAIKAGEELLVAYGRGYWK